MSYIPRETQILRDRIAYLEEELRQMRDDICPPKNPFDGRFKLTPQCAAVAFALYRHSSVTQPHLDRVLQVYCHDYRGTDLHLMANRAKVAICRLRKTFKKLRVEIETIRGVGYRISLEHKARLRKLLAK